MTFGAMPCVVLNQIKSIADQCPDEGGFVVFAARAWYRLFEPGTDWEGLDGCGQNRASVAQNAAHERPSVRVVPNPAQGHLFVIMDTAPAQGTRFELRSATGAKVLEISLSASYTAVDVSVLAPGLYFYTVQSPGGLTQSGKLNIIR